MLNREDNLLRSLFETTWKFYVWVGFLAAILLWGIYAYFYQFRNGLIVTGLRDQFSWGLYITNFVFFIGISHAGTLISAILRVTDCGWRRPITRMAEAITVFALCIGAPMVIIDLGRPDRLLNLFRYGRIQSPIVWDVLSVSTYLTGCLLYFYIPMIPDLGMLAERPGLSRWRHRLYSKLSLGWKGTEEQKHLLEKAISVMAVMIIPLAVSVHTVVSWIFAMTMRPGWDSSIFGPYFVIGAIYSGTAAVIFSMGWLRKIFHFEEYVQPKHFRNLGLLLLAFALLYLYFNINEYLTVGYKLEGRDRELLQALFVGQYAMAFWTVQSVGVFLPILLMLAVLALRRNQQFVIPGVVLASGLVIIGAWAKRYLIVIPTLQTPFLPAQRLPWEWTHYRPTWVEWSITTAAVAGFLLIYTLLVKTFPIISIWETRQDEPPEPAEVAADPWAASRQWWRRSRVTAIGLLLAFLLLACGGGYAAESQIPKTPKVASISLKWQTVAPATKTDTSQGSESQPASGRTYLQTGHIFDPFHLFKNAAGDEQKASALQLIASLHGPAGEPIAFKPVDFSLKTTFGSLSLGSRPTLANGEAQFIIRDRRYGQYPLTVSFRGDDEYAPVRHEFTVAFAPRPGPALPAAGVLITPYATPAVGVPFVVFYGLMWVVFVYAFVYLVLYKMRRAGSPKAKAPGVSQT